MPLLAWYPPEILLPLLLPLALFLLLWGRRRSIWWRNLGLAAILFILANFIFMPDLPARFVSAYTTAAAETAPAPLFPELLTPTLRGSPEDLLAAAARLPGFAVISQDADARQIELRSSIPATALLPVSHVTAQFMPARAGTRVFVRAAWPEKSFDLGSNRRVILWFLWELEKQGSDRQ